MSAREQFRRIALWVTAEESERQAGAAKRVCLSKHSLKISATLSGFARQRMGFFAFG
jgi:ABC-type thiamine transport system ATPase subunit